jgi:hypothetical protein
MLYCAKSCHISSPEWTGDCNNDCVTHWIQIFGAANEAVCHGIIYVIRNVGQCEASIQAKHHHKKRKLVNFAIFFHAHNQHVAAGS